MLEGKTIKKVRPMADAEMRELYREGLEHKRPMVVELSDGSVLIPSSDPAMNDPGHLLAKDVAGKIHSV